MVVLIIVLAIIVVALIASAALVVPRRRLNFRDEPPPARGVDSRPGVGDDAEVLRDTPTRSVGTVVDLPPDTATTDAAPVEPAITEPALDVPEPTAGRLLRLRARLARSQTTLGKGLLSVLSRERLDEDAWEEIEEALLSADVGVGATTEIVDSLRTRTKVLGTRSQGELRALLSDELVTALQPEMDRTLHSTPTGDRPAVVMVVGVNGTGKTTTCGKLARVLVADGPHRPARRGRHVPGRGGRPAADLGLAGRGRHGPRSRGRRPGQRRLRHGEAGGGAQGRHRPDRHRRPVAHQGRADGRAGKGQTGYREAVAGRRDAAGARRDDRPERPRPGPGLHRGRRQSPASSLTKLDGTAKGGIVISVQRELGVPVKLIGLGEGADDLAPFEPEAFVDALLGDASE